MSLVKKTIVMFLLVGVSFCACAYIALKLTVFPTFAEFENRSVTETLARVDRILQSDLRGLDIMNIEYSAWDDTYDFVLGRMPEYADDNLDPDYWHSVDLNLFTVFDAGGNRLFGWVSDPVTDERQDFDGYFDSPVDWRSTFASHSKTTDFVGGLINTRDGPMLIASRPVVTSESTGPIAGTLVLGQTMSEERMLEFGVRATADVAIYLLTGEEFPDDVEAATHALQSGSESVLIDIDEDVVHGYRLVPGVQGTSDAVLRASLPREISQIGATTVRTATFLLAGASLIFLMAAWLFMHRQITEPIRRLTNQILNIKQTGDLSVAQTINRSDEVGVLATEFAGLASRLQHARSELENSRDDALAMSDAKSEFLARMSHEIRTPMNGVLGMTELLRDTKMDDKQQRFAKTIQDSAESLLQIINDILDISKIEAGKIELDVASFNLRNVVEECLELLAEQAHRKGIELICAISVETQTYVRGDSVRLRQILMNLVGNAIKFTESGEVVVRVAETESSPGCYRFEVSDTGVGVKPENLERIFDPFSQEDGSTTRRYGGTGLGLSICKQLVELMDGEIGVDSRPGQGCTFWFTAALELDETTSELTLPALFVDKHVLIVDDNKTNREILCHQLESWSMRVTSANSGAEALRILAEDDSSAKELDVVLLDMSMPEMDGLELARHIRKIDGLLRTPIVMLSSLSRADISKERIQTGPEDWLTKPVRQSRLFDVLLSTISNVEQDEFDEKAGNVRHDAGDTGGLYVLLADDNAVNRDVASAMLESLGHRCFQVENGLEAVAEAQKQEFDVVLMDCRMPELDGYDATRMIRKWEQEAARSPLRIVALTANALQGDSERCHEAGMDDYLSKPVTIAHLKAAFDEVTKAIQPSQRKASPSQARDRVTDDLQESSNVSRRVLVVDDNIVNQQVASAMLLNLGFESRAASAGDEALRLVSDTHFDLILMDCHMPGKNGYETTREIRSREAESGDVRIPIVALTADFLETNRQKCLDSGMDDYATKPVTQKQMSFIINRWLPHATSDQNASALRTDEDGFSQFGDTVTLASIDQNVIAELRALDPGPGAFVLREIVMSFCASATKLMLQLRTAIADGDAELIGQIAHSLKGSSSQIGASLFAGICDELIAACGEGDLSDVDAIYERAAIEHSAVISGLDKELQASAA